MTNPSNCPRCSSPLSSIEESLTCDACHGVFVEGDKVRDDLFAEATEAAGDVADSPLIGCPRCHTTMRPLQLAEAVIDRCPSCGGVWLDGGEVLDDGRPADVPRSLARYFLYSLTLPERAVRSSVGLAAGAAQEAAGLLVPQAFQSSKTYELAVRNSLRFLTEDVGGVASKATDDDEEAPEGYMARKAVGNFVDLAGLATLHVSPVWIMAIVSDVAYGTKGYVQELAVELKQQGLIDDTSTIHHVDDVLDAVRNASGNTASLFDTPPLSVDQLKQSLDETRRSLHSADIRRVIPEAELRSYWAEMREVSSREGVSLLGVSGALTMHTLGKVSTVTRGTLTGVNVVGGLFNRHIVGHYIDSLKTVRERGFYQTLRDSSTPYIEAVWNNFTVDRDTWTEQILSGRAVGAAFRTVTGWLRRNPEATPEPEDDAGTASQPAE